MISRTYRILTCTVMAESTGDAKFRSKVRRRAGFRLEKAHPIKSRELRKAYDTPEWRVKWGLRFHASRTEQIRADLAGLYQSEYKKYLKEESENERNR